ncbi:hypothetical protein DAPPUDRAFT_234540 [Daphnia pulex]|uniref:Uncharacterized protein n=1 Tax=Daphnia pulex TaxID=6669 RepID=E9FWV2_DAPPU|nr:hypothetical protein DAPPUDRAFT_234540 [Daphnia pulex]|eukprot:EFX87960.1 hypothetical protein DAPPUDRAFT_234540 [Daphnia pulex]
MEQLSAPLVSSSEVDGGGGGGGGGMRNHAVKPVIPPKPEGYGTLGRASSRDHHKSENGSATVEQNRLSYSSQRPKSTEMLTEFQIPAAAAAAMAATMATTGTANPPSSTATNSNPATRQSPRSPRSKPPAPPVPNSPRPLPHQFSLADSQGSVLADLTLDCPCPLLTQQTGGGAGGGSSSSGSVILAGGSKHQSAYEPQLSVWNPLIEPPQLFQSAMDLDLSFDSGNIDPDPSDHQQPQQQQPHHQPPVIIKPAPPPPLSSMSFQSVQQFYPEPMKPTKVEPPRLPSVPPVSSSLTLNLSMDPLSSSRSISKTDPVKPVMPMANDLNKMMMSKLDHQSGGGGGGGAHHSSSSSSSSASSGGISAPPSVHSAMQRVEPRVTSDLVKLESNSMTMTTGRLTADPLAQSSTSSSVDTSSSGAASSKPSRVLPLKPFPDSSLSHNKASSVGCQSLESIQSNPSTIDTTDSPHSLLAPNESITARNALNSELHSRATASSSQPQQQQPNGLGRPTDSTDQVSAAAAAVTSKHNTSSSSSSSSAAAAAASAPLSTPLLLPAPHPPPPPPPSSYMTIDIDPSGSSAAASAAAAATGSSSTGSGGGDSSGEKVVDFYPPNSFRPYSFHSECWRKEIPEDETKWQMYKRRFCEFVFNFVACCIRCIGPV